MNKILYLFYLFNSTEEFNKTLFTKNSTTIMCPWSMFKLYKSSIDIRYTEEYGEQQWNSTRLHISFHRSLNISTSLIIHLIIVQNTEEHNRTTLMKKIGFSYNLYNDFI